MAQGTKIYANAVAKYNEGRLLDREKIRRLIESDFADAIKILCDYGYGGGIVSEKSYDIDKFISQETTKLIEYVVSDSPDVFLARCLTNRYLYSNAKALYKNKFTNVDLDAALYKFDDGDLKNAIASNDYSSLNNYLADALTSLNATFTLNTADPKTIDSVLTKAMFADNIYCAKKSGSKIMQKYVVAEIDLNNILTVLRCKTSNIDGSMAENMLFDGGTLANDDLLSIYKLELSAYLVLFKDTDYSDIVTKLADNYSLVRMQADAEDYLYILTALQQNNMLSLSPFLSYYNAQIIEFKTVKMILVCLKNNAKEEIFKRISSIYA